MKKTLALLLCLAMLFTALSVNVFAVENPSVTIVTNNVSTDGDTSFAIKLAGFESLKGIDMTVTATGGIEMLSASALNFKDSEGNIVEIAKDTDYVISDDGRTLHIVGLQKDVKGDIITVDANVTADATISVTADLAKSAEELYTETEIAPATITYATSSEVEVGNKEVVEQADAGEGYFIPYGAVYNGTTDAPKYLPKDENGTFANVTADTTVVKFPIPANGFGTYGVSDGKLNSMLAKQFGNYVADYKPGTRTYGTLAIMGDWAEYRDYYLSKKGMSDAELVEMLYAKYKEKKDTGYANNYVAFGVKENDNKYIVQVMAVQQNNYLWRTADKLEYGVRFLNVLSEREYATVAYYTEDNAINFAKVIRAD